MKLYTEEQLHNTVVAVSNYLDDINLGRAQEKIEKHLKALQPIELPDNDEDAGKIALYISSVRDEEKGVFIIAGAMKYNEWIRSKILNQNK